MVLPLATHDDVVPLVFEYEFRSLQNPGLLTTLSSYPLLAILVEYQLSSTPLIVLAVPLF